MDPLAKRLAEKNGEQLLALRVAARHARDVEAITFPREFHLPPHVRPKPAHVPEGTDLAIWTWEDPVGPKQELRYFLIIFAGKSNKPLVGPFYYPTEQARQHRIDETIAARKSSIEYKQKRQQERKDFKHDAKVGDIYEASWGYDQTNIDYYEVVEVKDKMFVVRHIGQTDAGSEGQGTDLVLPAKGSFTGPPRLVRPSPGGSITVDGHHARKWDGKPARQTALGWGH